MYGTTNMEITKIPALEITSRQGLAKDLYFETQLKQTTWLAQLQNLSKPKWVFIQEWTGNPQAPNTDK